MRLSELLGVSKTSLSPSKTMISGVQAIKVEHSALWLAKTAQDVGELSMQALMAAEEGMDVSLLVDSMTPADSTATTIPQNDHLNGVREDGGLSSLVGGHLHGPSPIQLQPFSS